MYEWVCFFVFPVFCVFWFSDPGEIHTVVGVLGSLLAKGIADIPSS